MKTITLSYIDTCGHKYSKYFCGKTNNEISVYVANFISNHPEYSIVDVKIQ